MSGKKQKNKASARAAEAFRNLNNKSGGSDGAAGNREGKNNIVNDILGSYTGTAADGSAPEQDADDL